MRITIIPVSMNKPKKTDVNAQGSKQQSKISSFFQSKSDSSSTGRLFSSVPPSNTNKLSLKKKQESKPSNESKRSSLSKGHGVSNRQNITIKKNGPTGTSKPDISIDKNKVIPSDRSQSSQQPAGKSSKQINADEILSPLRQEKKQTSKELKNVLSQASAIIASITDGDIDNQTPSQTDHCEEEITCIPETQFLTASPSLDTRRDVIKPASLSSTPGREETQDIIPDTPQEKYIMGKKKANRNFLSSSSALTRRDPLYKKLKDRTTSKSSVIIAKKNPPKKTDIRTLEDAMKSNPEELEFATPATMCALTTGVTFGREPLIHRPLNSAKPNINDEGQGRPVLGSLGGVKRSPVSGISPNPKRTMRSPPSKSPDFPKSNRPKKFRKNLSNACRNIMLKENKVAQDSIEKNIHLADDDDLASVLSDLKDETTSHVSKKGLLKKDTVSNDLRPNEAMDEDVHVPNHNEPDDALDELISELRQNFTQSHPKSQQFKTRTEQSILSAGLTPRPVKVAKRQISSNVKHVSSIEAMEVENPSRTAGETKQSVDSDRPNKTVDVSNCATNSHEFEELDTAVEEDLQKDFSALSPFKTNKAFNDFDVTCVQPPASHYGRCKVEEVSHKGCDVVLRLSTDPGDEERHALLTGFWADIRLDAGCYVHILGQFDESGKITITDSENMLIVHPDHLISGTSVVSALFCMRKAVLNERFKGYDSKNIHMLHGTIIHSFFQKVVQQRRFEDKQLEEIARSILQEHRIMHDMYGQSVDAESVLEEIRKYIPQLRLWADKYLPNPLFSFGQNPPQAGNISVTRIADIEENVWSPRFGVKGKIDMTVEVKIHVRQKDQNKKLVPLELKTGRASHSAEHKGQVTLYSMMSSDRRTDPESGLLLYLKDGSMTTVPAGHSNKRGLVQLRNELAHHLNMTITTKQGSGLPRPINNQRACSKCPQLLNCVAYNRVFRDYELDSKHALSTIDCEALAHLQPQHLEYYQHWIKLMMTELATGGKKSGLVKDLWCKTGWEREQEGHCLSGMFHCPTPGSAIVTETGHYTQEFRRIKKHPSHVFLKNVGINMGDNLVVSAENEPMIAISMGGVVDISQNSITLLLDRDLHKTDKECSLIYRLDKADTYNTMGSNMTNLTRLMEDTEASSYLRDIVIEKKTPEFETTLAKDALVKVKPLFKTLNKPQKTALLKVLMCKDYVLIKGYPGTGKTSTIVNLVEMLVLLGRTVLLTSYTHSAVDNILLKLRKNDVEFIRLGRPERIHPDIRAYSSELNTLKMTEVAQLVAYYSSSPVVATTCLGVGTHPIFSHRKFDICIVDEASQVLQPACLGPLFASRKFVLVGDPLQLPPVVQSHEARKSGMDESLFARLDDTGGTYELNLQYRMNSEIVRLSNELVYNGALVCGNDLVASGELSITRYDVILQYPQWIQKIFNPETKVAFLNMDEMQTKLGETTREGIRNVHEAEVVTLLAQVAVKAGVPASEIGVVTPYRQQVILLKEKLENLGVEVNTVDQYQGRDKSFIIVSFVKQKPGHGSGILEDLRRLNVALTRARHKLILVGSVSALTAYRPIKAVLDILRPDQILSLPSNVHHD